MNRIVKEHYPVSALPEDLRATIPDATHVTLTIEEERPCKSVDQMLAELDEYRAANPHRLISMEEAVTRIRTLRDEWDD
jgi:hypothetical protein